MSAPQTAMTIGALSRRTGVPVKLLREYEDAGLIYTVGRSAGNYRLFGDEAVWCVAVVTGLRSVGLTMAEICELTRDYLHNLDEPIGPRLAELLVDVRKRTTARIDDLRQLLERLDRFEADNADQLAGRSDFRQWDPRSARLDSPPGGKP
jgi:MerR family copper efflux transcriptional regulator